MKKSGRVSPGNPQDWGILASLMTRLGVYKSTFVEFALLLDAEHGAGVDYLYKNLVFAES